MFKSITILELCVAACPDIRSKFLRKEYCRNYKTDSVPRIEKRIKDAGKVKRLRTVIYPKGSHIIANKCFTI